MLQDYLNLMIETNFSICKICKVICIIKRFKLKPLKNQKQQEKGKEKIRIKEKEIENDKYL